MASRFITGNLVLDMGMVAWLCAQILKIIITWIAHRKWDIKLLLSSGGMPSSHSSFVCAIAASIACIYGVQDTYFALAAALAVVVMYDACNVRRAAGEQAKILNHIIEHWDEMSPDFVGRELKELLGHTPLQVFMGAILGIAVGYGGAYFFI